MSISGLFYSLFGNEMLETFVDCTGGDLTFCDDSLRHTCATLSVARLKPNTFFKYFLYYEETTTKEPQSSRNILSVDDSLQSYLRPL